MSEDVHALMIPQRGASIYRQARPFICQQVPKLRAQVYRLAGERKTFFSLIIALSCASNIQQVFFSNLLIVKFPETVREMYSSNGTYLYVAVQKRGTFLRFSITKVYQRLTTFCVRLQVVLVFTFTLVKANNRLAALDARANLAGTNYNYNR